MGITQIGFKGANQVVPRLDVSQPNGGQQTVLRFAVSQPLVLQAGQNFVLPAGQWSVNPGRYTSLQWYDTNGNRWRTNPTQPGQQETISSDGTNWRLANTTGTPIGAVISNVGNGNATNGYNTVTVTPSAGNSTWGTLVGGSLNTTVTVTTGGNYALPPHIIWQPGANQTFPYIPPTLFCNINANGTINTVTVNYGGAGLTTAGTLSVVQQAGDANPAGGVLTPNTTLVNSGNLTAIWPLTQGSGVTAVPTLTFNVGGTMCANTVMNFTVSNMTIGTAGANLGVSARITFISANGVATITQNAALTGTDYGLAVSMPRMAWLATTSEANGNFSNNGNVVIQDAGLFLQAVPQLTALVSNYNGSSTNALPVVTATVGGITDTSYIQAI